MRFYNNKKHELWKKNNWEFLFIFYLVFIKLSAPGLEENYFRIVNLEQKSVILDIDHDLNQINQSLIKQDQTNLILRKKSNFCLWLTKKCFDYRNKDLAVHHTSKVNCLCNPEILLLHYIHSLLGLAGSQFPKKVFSYPTIRLKNTIYIFFSSSFVSSMY